MTTKKSDNFNQTHNAYLMDLESAKTAYKNNLLFDWAQEYLRGEGWNKGLADNLMQHRPVITQLIEFPLNKLIRIMGPEKDINYPEDIKLWEKRVDNLTRLIDRGIQLPPLIVTDIWKESEIADGSHRHEALLRCGYQKYWVIFFFSKAV